MFDFAFEVAWNVIPVSDVSDPCERYCCGELVSETGKIGLDTADYEAVHIVCQRQVECLIDVICDIGMMIWAEMGAVFSARDLSRAYEVEIGRKCGKALHLEALSIFVLVYELRYDFQFLLPSASFTVHLAKLLDEFI